MKTKARIYSGVVAFIATSATYGAILVNDVTVLSPERSAPLEHAYVLIENGKISSVGTTKPNSPSPQSIDGQGKFLIPGLIDSHVHLLSVPGMSPLLAKKYRPMAEEYLRQVSKSYLYYGYTTLIDLNVANRKFIDNLKASETSPEIYDCDGALVSANGYPMHYIRGKQRFEAFPNFLYDSRQSATIPRQYSPAEHAPAYLVDKVKKTGAVCIKTFYETGFEKGAHLPTPDRAMLDSIAGEARRQGLKLMVHANSFLAQSFAIASPIDILAHGMWRWDSYSDSEGLPEAIRKVLDQIVSENIGYQPTIQVIAGLKSMFNPTYLKDPRLENVVPKSLLDWFQTKEGAWFARSLLEEESIPSEKLTKMHDQLLNHVKLVVRYLADHEGRLLFGTDTPSAPTYGNVPGLNGYLEMEQWTQAGVPLDKLFRAATIENAKAFGLEDRVGTVTAGKTANLVLLHENPLQSVKAYQTIDTVIVKGKVFPRKELSAKPTK